MVVDLEKSLEELRGTFRSRKTRSAQWRRSQLTALLRLVQEREEEMFKVLQDDLGKPSVEGFRDEVGVLRKSLNLALRNLEKWMAPKSVGPLRCVSPGESSGLCRLQEAQCGMETLTRAVQLQVGVPLMAFPTTAQLVPEPLGLVLIISSWNFPIGLSLDPLVGAIAAGNAVVVKPSELAPASSAFLAGTIPLYLDSTAVKVIEGGAEVGEKLLSKKWDHIFFTGSQRIGRRVMEAAAKHLTPVTLELGGKCPAILDSLSCSRDREVAMKRIVNGKWGVCGGQVCIGVDYLLVEQTSVASWIELMKEKMKGYYGVDPRKTNTISRIVNKHHFHRLKRLIQEPAVAASIIHGGSMDEDNLYIEPTILLNPPLGSEIMTEEIFGPLLPIITVKRIEESIDIVNSLPKPLAIYLFSKDDKLKEKIISETSSGSVTFNDAIIQFLLDTLPFGGVGQSGFGRYHGRFSFDTFSHEKAVLRRPFLIEFSFGYPPWSSNKLTILRSAYNYDYLGLVLSLLGLKR